MRHSISSPQLLQSIFSDMVEANEGADVEDLIASIPSAIEEILPYAIYNVGTAPVQLSDVAIRFRELKNKRKQQYIRSELEDLGSDPEVVLIDAKTILNQWSHSDSPGIIPLGFSPNVSAQIPDHFQIMKTGKSFAGTKFIDVMKKGKSVIGQRSLLVMDDSDSNPHESEKLDSTNVVSDLPAPLQKIKSKLIEHQLLSLHDIIDMNHVMKNGFTQEKELDAVLSLLKMDVETRNQKFNGDCIEKLYENQNLLPKGRRMTRPLRRDKHIRIKEMIQAIILDEYEKDRRKISQDFLTKTIDYETYRDMIRALAKTTDSTWQK